MNGGHEKLRCHLILLYTLLQILSKMRKFWMRFVFNFPTLDYFVAKNLVFFHFLNPIWSSVVNYSTNGTAAIWKRHYNSSHQSSIFVHTTFATHCWSTGKIDWAFAPFGHRHMIIVGPFQLLYFILKWKWNWK